MDQEQGSRATGAWGWLSQAWDLVGMDLPVLTIAAFIAISLSLLSGFILTLPMLAGLCIMFMEKMQGNRPTLHHLWEGFLRFPATISIWILYLVAGLPLYVLDIYIQKWGGWTDWSRVVGLGTEFLGNVLIATPLFFTIPLIADRDISAREALRLSWAQVHSRFRGVFVCVFVYTVVFLFGFIACGVGVMLTLPVVVAAQMLAYHDLYGDFEVPHMIPIKEPGNEEKTSEDETDTDR